MKYCCERMEYFLQKSEGKKGIDSDDIICYTEIFDEYGIVIHDLGKSFIKIKYCPWCGKKLPSSKRDRWFNELEKLGIENPLEEEIPSEFRTDEWWNTKNKMD